MRTEPAPALSAEIEFAPLFSDVDAMEVVYHGNYLRYLEMARSALLQKFDYDYPQMRASGYAWPIVDLRIKYLRPLRYGQRLRLRAGVVEWENRLRIDYLLRDAASGQRLTTAWTIQVAVDVATQQMRYVCPPVLWEKLGVQP